MKNLQTRIMLTETNVKLMSFRRKQDADNTEDCVTALYNMLDTFPNSEN